MGCSLDVGSLDNGSTFNSAFGSSEFLNKAFFLNSHTLLTELVTKIEEYRETITDQSEGKATKIMLKHVSQTTGVHPIETSLRNVISPFALAVVKGQISQCIQYTIDESLTQTDSFGEEICFVKMATGFAVGNSTTQVENSVIYDTEPYNTDGELISSEFLNACDLALENNISSSKKLIRKTTTTSCTCLFPTCWGLPCRHQLRIYLQKNVSYVPNEVISKSWIVKTADQRRESLLELFTIQPTILHDVHTTPRTKYERYAILASEFKSVAHIASLSVESTEELRSQLRNFITNTLKSKNEDSQELNNLNYVHTVKNPKVPSSKGRPRQKRIRGINESYRSRKKDVSKRGRNKRSKIDH